MKITPIFIARGLVRIFKILFLIIALPLSILGTIVFFFMGAWMLLYNETWLEYFRELKEITTFPIKECIRRLIK